MATYYVDFVNGLDANNGLGPDASAVSNKPWKTITKALGASGIASGDTVYLSPAGPFREVISVAMTAPTAETKILGDPSNAQGFKTSGGAAVAPGIVRVTGFTTNDTSAASNTTLLNLNGKNHLTFQYIQFDTGNARAVDQGTGNNNTFKDCAFIANAGTAPVFAVGTAANVAATLTVDRCLFVSLSQNPAISIVLTRPATADFDYAITVRNCEVLGFCGGNALIDTTSTGANSFKGGGVRLYNLTAIFAGTLIRAGDANLSTTVPGITVANSLLVSGNGTALSANTSGQIVEDYNRIWAVTPRTNVSTGTHSDNTKAAPLFHFGQERIWGMFQRPFGEPLAGSPLLAFGNDGNQSAYDGLNRPKPAGGASASAGIGWLERGNTLAKETSTVHTGSVAGKFTGPGYQDFDVPVDASSTTLSIYLRYDSTYAGTRPQITLLANDEIGVATQTVTATTSALNAWEQESFAAFTPSAKGIVTVRVISNDTNGGGAVYVDTFASA